MRAVRPRMAKPSFPVGYSPRLRYGGAITGSTGMLRVVLAQPRGFCAGVERAITILKEEIERDMKLMGVKSVSELTRDRLRWR